jgi:group II intron reverse transcriptase/maturase
VDDRIVQAAVCLVIEPLFETGFEDCSFGFRPGRSADMARQRIYKLLNWGCEFVVETDIEAFFGTIPHDRLMKAVERRISDSRVLGLIRGWLKAKVHADGVLSEPEAGTPQGGPLSPLLANIYLDQLDKAWRELGMDDKNGPDAKLVRYADDLVILTSKDPMVPYRALGR